MASCLYLSRLAGAATRLGKGDQFVDQGRVILLFESVDFPIVFVYLARIIHGAELGTAHGAEGGFLIVVVGQGFIVHGARRIRVERKRELFFPIKLVARVAESVIA